MLRSLALGFCATAVLAAGGCTQNGSYRVTWDFLTDTTVNATQQSAAVGCGQHGVDSILVTGTDTTGDGDQVLAICALGQLVRPVPAGTWTIQVQAVNAENVLMPAVLPTEPIPDVVVNDGAISDLSTVVTLTPPPACSDGIDNDGDGRVDLADPDCANDPNGAHE